MLNLPDPLIEFVSLTSPALAGGFFTTSTTWEAPYTMLLYFDYCHPSVSMEGLVQDVPCIPKSRNIQV